MQEDSKDTVSGQTLGGISSPSDWLLPRIVRFQTLAKCRSPRRITKCVRRAHKHMQASSNKMHAPTRMQELGSNDLLLLRHPKSISAITSYPLEGPRGTEAGPADTG